ALVALRFLAKVQVLAVREVLEAVVPRRADEADDLTRPQHRVWSENQSIEHAERSRGHPDPERNRHHDERGEAWRAAQASDRIANVVEEISEPVDVPRVPHLFLLLLHAAHRAQGAVTRIFGRQALGDAFGDLVVQVKPQLLVELLIRASTAEDRLEP